MELVNRVAIVTGGAVRVGRALSLALAREGMDVCVHFGHSADAARETVRDIEQLGRRAIAVSADFVSEADAADRVLDAVHRQYGRADVLVNSAAIFEADTLESIDDRHFDRHVNINLRAPLMLSQAFVRRLPADGVAHIVNIVDWRALRPPPGHLVYTMTKAALVALTKMLAQELAPRVRVNAIAPGAILPPTGADREYEKRLATRVPLRRTGTVDDVAAGLVYLLKSEFQTGEILCITGGEHL